MGRLDKNNPANHLAVSIKFRTFVREMMTSAYRPRNPGHDYYGRGTYLVTLVVSGRERRLSHFAESNEKKGVTERGALVLTSLGEAVRQA